MGQSQSKDIEERHISTEQISHELALRFATECFTALEITHFKDNFKTLADHQDDIEYWKEETLCRFLCIPNSLQAGSVVYAMCTYLGAFPFPTQAPAILTREAMLKCITLFTARYSKILKKGNQDKTKLLFRSLAIFDRRSSMNTGSQKQQTSNTNIGIFTEEDVRDLQGAKNEEDSIKIPLGFPVDIRINDDEEEDDDDLALAALDALDAIEVFKHDQKADRKISHANIPASNLKRLVELLLAMIWLSAQENLAIYSQSLTKSHLARLDEVSQCVVQAFDPDGISQGISYHAFVNTVMTSVPHLFEPLNPLFERFLFSKNLDLSRHRDAARQPPMPESLGRRSQILGKSDEQGILDQASLSQLKVFLDMESSPVLAICNHTIAEGDHSSSEKQVTIGAYLPGRWRNASTTKTSEDSAKSPVMFQLSPRHAVFPGNSLNKSLPFSYFSNDTGIALGCVIPLASRTHGPSPVPALGPVGLLIDSDIAAATFQHDGDGGLGAFMTDRRLEAAQRRGSVQHKKIEIDIDVLEVWGINTTDDKGQDEATKQKERLAWDEAEAARRRGVNFGGDKNGARALLEMAGIVGDSSDNRTGGSV